MDSFIADTMYRLAAVCNKASPVPVMNKPVRKTA